MWELPQFQGGFTLWDLPCVVRMMVLVVSLVSLELWSVCTEVGSTLTLQTEIIFLKNQPEKIHSFFPNISKI